MEQQMRTRCIIRPSSPFPTFQLTEKSSLPATDCYWIEINISFDAYPKETSWHLMNTTSSKRLLLQTLQLTILLLPMVISSDVYAYRTDPTSLSFTTKVGMGCAASTGMAATRTHLETIREGGEFQYNETTLLSIPFAPWIDWYSVGWAMAEREYLWTTRWGTRQLYMEISAILLVISTESIILLQAVTLFTYWCRRLPLMQRCITCGSPHIALDSRGVSVLGLLYCLLSMVSFAVYLGLLGPYHIEGTSKAMHRNRRVL